MAADPGASRPKGQTACPFLRAATSAGEADRCLVAGAHSTLSAAYTACYCLTPQHTACSLFHAARPRSAVVRGRAAGRRPRRPGRWRLWAALAVLLASALAIGPLLGAAFYSSSSRAVGSPLSIGASLSDEPGAPIPVTTPDTLGTGNPATPALATAIPLPAPPAAIATSPPTATPPLPTATPVSRAWGGLDSDYFVSMSGSDRNDGRTPGTAWRTFAPVGTARVPPGATVAAEAGGVWQESIKIQARDLRFVVYGDGPRPKIVAPDGQYAFDGNWKSGIHLQGWEFTSSTRRGGEWGIVFVARDDYVVRDIVVHGVDGWMFTARGVRGLVENSEFFDNDGEGPTHAVNIGGHEGEGDPDPDDRSVFRDNYIHNTGYRALSNWGSNVLFEGNRIERWSKGGILGSATQAPAGIYIQSTNPGTAVVRNNTLVGSGTEFIGIWVDVGPPNQTVIEGNTVANASQCMWAEKTDNVVFRGNTCAQMRRVGVRWGSGDVFQDPSENGEIVGNTFIGPQPAEGWIKIYPGATARVADNTFR